MTSKIWKKSEPLTGPHLHDVRAKVKTIRKPTGDQQIVFKKCKRPKLPAGAGRITKDTIYTVGITATHDPRYQVGPDEKVYGAGFSACGIGRDIDTGKGWKND